MADIHSPQQRHVKIAAIHGKDTQPEMVVCRYLWGMGSDIARIIHGC